VREDIETLPTQVPSTGSTAKALEMKHFGLSSHNKIVLGKYSAAGRALGAVQPEQRIFRCGVQ